MNPVLRRFDQASEPWGPCTGALAIGEREIHLSGLSEEQEASLAHAFADFWRSGVAESAAVDGPRVRLVDAGGGYWNGAPEPNELYRVEPLSEEGRMLALAYAFALEEQGDGYKLAIATETHEPAYQTIENGLRLVVARDAVRCGGFAMHAAGLVREGRAWLFAGPSNSGKTTVVTMSQPAISLGDDLALVLPEEDGWRTPALPFDNAPVAPPRPQQATYPVAGIFKLVQDDEHRIERPSGLIAATSLAGLLALPWAMPDLGGRLLEQATRFCQQATFGHLHFKKDAEFWPLLEGGG